MFTSKQSELIEVFFQLLNRAPILLSSQCRIAENLARSCDLAQAAAPARVGECQVEKFERTVTCAQRTVRVLCG